MKRRTFDLAPFIGRVKIAGLSNGFAAFSDDPLHGKKVSDGYLDATHLPRYIFSDTPFTVEGNADPRWKWKSAPVSEAL